MPADDLELADLEARPAKWLPVNPRRFRQWRKHFLVFLAVVGPGIITANVDNDAGGILTYSQAGAGFGYSLLWTLVPITVALMVVQEMVARMGVVTGKGLSDLIREEYGLRATFILMMLLLAVNLGNTISEFAGLASGMSVLGVSRYFIVPAGAVFVWALVVKGTYRMVEKVFLVACLFYVVYPLSCFLAHPKWGEALALRPLAGRAAGALFAFGLCNASLFAASILPLATAYYVCEALGLESGINKRMHEAPAFYTLYTGLIGVGALAVILLPARDQIPVILLSQVLNGVLLPVVLIYMLRLINRQDLMGEYCNTKPLNVIAWTTCVVTIVLTLVSAVSSILGRWYCPKGISGHYRDVRRVYRTPPL